MTDQWAAATARMVVERAAAERLTVEADRRGLPPWDGPAETGAALCLPDDLAEVLGAPPSPCDAAAWRVWAETGRRFLVEEGVVQADAMWWWGRVTAARLRLLGVSIEHRRYASKGNLRVDRLVRSHVVRRSRASRRAVELDAAV